jgi:uncharacterized protein YodC (DUF2158 family)
MSDFKPGDVVRLKSGGPKMTLGNFVEMGGNPRTAYCSWFDGGKMDTAAIFLHCLEKVEEERSCEPRVEYRALPYGGKLLEGAKGTHVSDVIAYTLQEGYDGFVFNDVIVRVWKDCTIGELMEEYNRLHKLKYEQMYGKGK